MTVVFWAGVLWLGTAIIQGSPNAINFLKKSGKRIFYVTNNSTKTQKELLSKIDSMGFNASEVCFNLFQYWLGKIKSLGLDFILLFDSSLVLVIDHFNGESRCILMFLVPYYTCCVKSYILHDTFSVNVHFTRWQRSLTQKEKRCLGGLNLHNIFCLFVCEEEIICYFGNVFNVMNIY